MVSIFEVRHQPRAQRLIQRALLSDRMPHAYIFDGPEGVGREMFARRLAKLLLCERPSQVPPDDIEGFESWTGALRDACHECDSCRVVKAGTHPDEHIIYRELIKQHSDPEVRARKGIELGIDVIRQFVIDRVANKAALGRAKVFIVRQADRMNTAAQNALLKTLEEPPATTFLILIVASLDVLLPTVRSRCQLIPFGLLPTHFIVDQLLAKNEAMKLNEALLCASYAAGSLGLAENYHEDRLAEHQSGLADVLADLPQVGVSELAKRVIASAKELGSAYQQRDKEISDTEAQRLGLKSLLSLLSMGYRDALQAAVGATLGSTPAACGVGPVSLTKPLPARRAGDAIRSIAAAERQLDLNANVQLCVEGLLVRLSRLAHA